MAKPKAKPRKPKQTLPVGPAKPQQAQRKANGQWAKGYSGWSGASDAARARRDLNLVTIAGMREAFDRYGRSAIEKVARQQPAIFLKMLVLLVPRELEITQSTGTKGMSDEALEAAVSAIEGFLARRAGDDAKLVEASAADTPSATKP